MTALVVGEALVDVVQHPGGEIVEHAGGSPFNVAVGLARLGVATSLATQVGDDRLGAILRDRLDDAGARLVDVGPGPARTSSATATLRPDGSADYAFDLTWDPQRLPFPAGHDVVHVGSLGTALAPGADAVATLVARASELRVPVSFDPNVRVSVEPDPARWRQVFATVSPRASIVKMSDEDAAVLFPDLALHDVASRLAHTGRLVAVTRGGDGAVLAAGPVVVEVDAPAVDVVDTIGAGDSFMAATLAWCTGRGWPAPSTLTADDLTDLGTHAARAAAITCSRPGADPPRTAELG